MALATPTAGLVGAYKLLDYVAYYPFVDGDSTNKQAMDNAVTLPRYTNGDGVLAMMVATAPTTGAGVFTYSYVDSDGNPQTSPTITVLDGRREHRVNRHEPAGGGVGRAAVPTDGLGQQGHPLNHLADVHGRERWQRRARARQAARDAHDSRDQHAARRCSSCLAVSARRASTTAPTWA